MRIKIRLNLKSVLPIAILYCAYFISLTCIYSIFLTKVFAYEGYVDEFNARNFFFSLLVTTIGAITLPLTAKPSSFFLHLGMGLIIVPTLTLFSSSNFPEKYVLISLSSFSLMAITSQLVRFPRLLAPKVRPNEIIFFCAAAATFLLLTILAFGGWGYFNLNFFKVYDLRRSAASILPGIYAYLTPAVSKAVIPFGIGLSALQKKWRNVILFSASSVFVFALTAHKSPAFFPLIILFIYWISSKKNAIIIFISSLIAIVILGGFEFWFYLNNGGSSSLFFASIGVRRGILLPSLLNWFYIDFFSDNPYYYWSQSLFSLGLTDSPFDFKFVNIIGREYFGSIETAANTGWIGSGYANAGSFGVYFYAALIGLFFSFLDSYAKKMGLPLVLSVFSIPVLTMLVSTDLTNMPLTHGLSISVLLLLIIKPISTTSSRMRGVSSKVISLNTYHP